MAGLGFKTFVADDILGASELNGYLMQQTVMVFATTTARDAAITAPTNGMLAYITAADSSKGLYFYNGSAWFPFAATQADQETATSVVTAVSPGRQQYHPSAAKFWVTYTSVTTTTILRSYNVASLTDGGVGFTTVNITIYFSGANYSVVGMSRDNDYAVGSMTLLNTNPTANTCGVLTVTPTTGALADSAWVAVTGFGDQ